MEGPFSLLTGHEQVVYGCDPESGLRCIIAIHSTALGPGLGGTRFYPYGSEEDALVDVLRLSEAMTYKAACAGLDLGGGKAVIIGDPATDKSEALLRAYGRMVESLAGRYVTAIDVGTMPEDLSIVRRETRWVTGAEQEYGGSGDPGATTAYGTYLGIIACAERVWGSADLGSRHVAVQGLGRVGRHVAQHLADAGARLSVADIDERAIAWAEEQLGAEVVPVDKIHATDADVFSPNALGGVLNESTVPELQCRVVAGAANNQLATDEDCAALADAGILFAPDFVINAGGLIHAADELGPGGFRLERARALARGIGQRLQEVFDEAEAQGVPTLEAARRVAERRIAGVGGLRRFYLRQG